jgi:hypothetical protein
VSAAPFLTHGTLQLALRRGRDLHPATAPCLMNAAMHQHFDVRIF